MSLLNEQVQTQIRQAFAKMTGPVKIHVFTQGEGGALECDYCQETRQLAEEIAALSDKLSVEIHDFVAESALAERLHIDNIPAIAILADGDTPKDYGIRIYGIPSGYEFGTLIEDIIMVSNGEHGLQTKTLDELKRLTKPVHIQVFATPT